MKLKFTLPRLLSLILLLAGILWTPSFAQPGSLDNTFGTNGIVVTSLGNFGDRGNSIAIQSDEKIVIGGYSQSSFTTSDFALVRYNNDGTLDASFGTDGKVITSLESRSEGNAIAIQNDGKIVLGGASDWYLNLVRYNTDGSLDTTFGTDGKVITDIEGYYSEQCKSVAIQDDGKILLGGYGQHFSNDMSYFILVRYNIDGTLDETFGIDGKVIGSLGKGHSINIQEDGKILLGGTTDWAFAIERYHNDGILDNSFGIDGKVLTLLGNTGEGNSLLIQNDGKILLGGYSTLNSFSPNFTLVRYNNDGSLDSSFGISGIVTNSVGGFSEGKSVLIQNDGKILLAGYAKLDFDTPNFAIAQYHNDGSLDDSFGTNGSVITIIGDSYSISNSMGIQSDGKIVLVGHVHNDSNIDIALVRYNGNENVATENAQSNQLEIKVYPNPFDSFSTIQFSKSLNNEVLRIYNAYGQLVQTIESISGQEVQFSRNNLTSGIYFFQLLEKNKIIAADKLIITEK